jgi:polyisoprenyl-teichoic acid--peptidoglycan teichoic acid transferase
VPARKTDNKPPSSGSNTTHPNRKKPFKIKQGHWLWLWLGFTGVAMLSATAGAMLAVSLSSTPFLQSRLSPDEAAVFRKGGSISSGSMRLPELTRPVNILVLGTKVLTSDLKEHPQEKQGYQALVNSFDGMTDTMLLLRFDPEAKRLAVLSIPRDTRTYVEGQGLIKINAANYYGGPALTAKATSDLLEGVGIDRYIRVNVQGVEKLIDALGGVTVYVPRDMKYKDDSQHLYINLKEGKQHLDGNKAMQFLRFRYDKYGDVGRVQRQQILMRALAEQALNPTTLARVPKILSIIQSHIDTNLSVEELVALVGFGVQTQRSNVQMLMVPGDFSGTGQHETSYWLPDQRRIQQMMAQYFDQGYGESNEADPAYLRVAIQDSTGDSEAVQAMVRTLQKAGYNNVRVDDSWKEPLRVTRIVAQQGDNSSASAVQESLGFGELRVESTGSLNSDVTIQLGQDWLQKQASSGKGLFTF